MKRIELHTNSYYSDKLSHLFPNKLFFSKVAKDCKAIALTDHNSIFNYTMAEEETKELNLAIIYGLSIDCIDNDDIYTVTVLAKNELGRKNIFRIFELVDNNSSNPCKAVTREQLEKHREGLLFGSSARNGQLARAIALRKSTAYLKKVAADYDYIEVSPEPYDITTKLMKLAKQCGKTLCAVQNAAISSNADETEYHAFRAISYYRTGEEFIESYTTSKELEESFKDLYILPDEQALVEEALWSGPESIFSQIEEMPSVINLVHNNSNMLHNEAMVTLRYEINAALERVYRNNPKAEVVEQLHKELDKIEEYHAAKQFMFLKHIADHLRRNNYSFHLAGAWASSLTLYLLGVNELDPLKMNLSPAHLFYKRDNLFQPELRLSSKAVESVISELQNVYRNQLIMVPNVGYEDISDEQTEELINQYIEDLCGTEIGKKLRNNSNFQWLVSNYAGNKIRTKAIKRLYLLPSDSLRDELPVIRDKNSGVLELQSEAFFIDLPCVNLVSSKFYETVDMCCHTEGLSYEEIPYESDELFDVLCKAHSGQLVPDVADAALTIMGDWEWLHHESLDFIEPRDLRSICRTRCLTHGTQLWENNQREMLYSNAMFAPDLICSREDVYKYLRARGVSEKAAADFMTDVRKGKICSRGYTNEHYKMLDDCDAEYWFIEACEKIQYLFPEAHEVCFSVSMLRLLWLALNGSAATKGTIIKYAAERER